MAQVLIIYGTAYGQTERIARRILGELERQATLSASSRVTSCQRICGSGSIRPLSLPPR